MSSPPNIRPSRGQKSYRGLSSWTRGAWWGGVIGSLIVFSFLGSESRAIEKQRTKRQHLFDFYDCASIPPTLKKLPIYVQSEGKDIGSHPAEEFNKGVPIEIDIDGQGTPSSIHIGHRVSLSRGQLEKGIAYGLKPPSGLVKVIEKVKKVFGNGGNPDEYFAGMHTIQLLDFDGKSGVIEFGFLKYIEYIYSCPGPVTKDKPTLSDSYSYHYANCQLPSYVDDVHREAFSKVGQHAWATHKIKIEKSPSGEWIAKDLKGQRINQVLTDLDMNFLGLVEGLEGMRTNFVDSCDPDSAVNSRRLESPRLARATLGELVPPACQK